MNPDDFEYTNMLAALSDSGIPIPKKDFLEAAGIAPPDAISIQDFTLASQVVADEELLKLINQAMED